jgi:hypothetical protein
LRGPAAPASTGLPLNLLQQGPTLIHPPLLDALPSIALDIRFPFINSIEVSLNTGMTTMTREGLSSVWIILLMLPQLVLGQLARSLEAPQTIMGRKESRLPLIHPCGGCGGQRWGAESMQPIVQAVQLGTILVELVI